MAVLRLAREVIKAAAARSMTDAAAGQPLPAADRRVDISGDEFYAVTAPAGAFGGDQSRAATEKIVEYNLAAGRAVEDRVGDHRHRLCGRGRMPDIAMLAPEPGGVNVGAVL